MFGGMGGISPVLGPRIPGGGGAGAGGGSTYVPPSTITKTAESCFTEDDCVANNHVWWQEGMSNPPACHVNPPESWLQVGGNQQMLLVGLGVASVLGVIGLWWYSKKE